MILKVGDIIYCKVHIENLTTNKSYTVINTRNHISNDICIIGDDGYKWWFENGKYTSESCWSKFFITEKEFIRNKKIKELGIN